MPDCRLHEDIGALLFKQMLTDVILVVVSQSPSQSSSPSIGPFLCSCSNTSPTLGHYFQSSTETVKDHSSIGSLDIPPTESDSESVDDVSDETASSLLLPADDQNSQVSFVSNLVFIDILLKKSAHEKLTFSCYND